MEINLGFVDKGEVSIQTIDLVGRKNLLLDVKPLNKIDNESLQILFYSDSSTQDEVNQLYQSYFKFFPVKNSKTIGLTIDQFLQNNFSQHEKILAEIYEKWVTINNLSTIEEFIEVTLYLKDLFKNDRQTFMEEFWYLLKGLLGTIDLKFIYHDVDTSEINNPAVKPKLLFNFVEGLNTPKFSKGTDIEEKIFNEFNPKSADNLTFIEFDPQKKYGSIFIKIDGSPILLIATLLHLNSLQKSVLTGLINGLQSKE